ncbi:MAG: hypothetical protein H0X26_08410 [Alphaproteobacteria bacterium]|nr:hypothetical protein [Alphaproteobacteria bacterium]
MSKTLILASLFGLAVSASSASASHCTCWKAMPGEREAKCLGRIHPFNAHPHDCVTACAVYEPELQPAGMIDDLKLNECAIQTRKVYGGFDNKKGKIDGEPW